VEDFKDLTAQLIVCKHYYYYFYHYYYYY